MHLGLGIVDVLQSIYDHLDTASSFHLALACTAFLEPGLDRVWRHLDSFTPLVSCLPEGLLIPQRVELESDDFYVVHYLRRDPQEEDLHRYLEYYAPRIRHLEVDPSDETTVIPIETLQALQLVTGHEAGTLSPNLRRLDWFVTRYAHRLPEDYCQQLSAYMILFLGRNITSMHVCLDVTHSLIHRTAVRAALKHVEATLKHLEVLGFELLRYPTSSLPWSQLQHLHAIGIEAYDIPRVATLPRLITFEVSTIEEPEPISIMEPPPVTNGFLRLECLEVETNHFSQVRDVLRHLSRENNLKTIFWDATLAPSISEVNCFIGVVGRRCTPTSFVHLKMLNVPWSPVMEAPVNIQPETLDLSPLFRFTNIVEVDIILATDLRLTPNMLYDIPRAWPRLQRLLLCPTFSTGLTPQIGPTHVAQLVLGLPCLQVLGLQFDATKVTGDERSEMHSTPISALHTLRVGGSPISSPPQVVAFLKAKFPELQTLDAQSWPGFDEQSLFSSRWEAVWEALEEA